MTRCAIMCATLILALVACSPATKAGDGRGAQSPQAKTQGAARKPIEGWGDFRFGMSLDDALVHGAGLQWTGESLVACRDEMPVHGCDLIPDPERSFQKSTAGMQLLPRLMFNTAGQLTDIGLQRSYEAGVTEADCERLHAQLIDFLVAQYGKGDVPAASEGMVRRSSKGGNAYLRSAKEGDSVAVFGGEKFGAAKDGTSIMLIDVFTTGSEYTKPRCSISAYFQGPKALERAASPLEWEGEADAGE